MTSAALSVQLYSVRDALTSDLDGTLAALAAMGLREVEVFDFVDRAPELAEALSRAGLRARTGHASLLSEGLGFDDPALADAQAGPPGQDRVFTAARTLGLEIVIDPFVAADRWLDEDAVLATARRLNDAAGKAADQGLRVGYHNHSQEFAVSFRGVSGYEVFADALRDDVALEVDLYWAATARQDVAALLGRLGERVRALHLKDGVIGDDPFRPGAARMDPTRLDQRPAGRGDLPLLEYLAAAPSTEFGVIEFDHYAGGDVLDGVRDSVEYFHANGLR
ncbi:sugar phosphate isomerase/epimerase [Nakamurella flavida]|uniref:Sugar phosphate isomerase/epimerase n=1 Tax=Nakamurella flavida TaxID=363630 RepID=A0A938YNM7_9ACTN|nr:sugar phosphate isomerase/epimerase [Nakamurella flavida]MBM9478053.1 sugar phosphate isomerase/epimerase [Nakamurella flavida]MDP9778230.1 sugar phosphate isomerase/epimerase [Nakamurella flavida]